MLIELAERKLGEGVTIRISSEGWIAEQRTATNRTRVTAMTRDTLEWALKQMPDREKPCPQPQDV